MAKFHCCQCGRRYSSDDEPRPGHLYEVPCKHCPNHIFIHTKLLDSEYVRVLDSRLTTTARA